MKGGHTFRISEESDSPSEARRKRAASDASSCEAEVIKVVTTIPHARALLDGPTDPAHGHPSNGLRLEAYDDAPTIVAVAPSAISGGASVDGWTITHGWPWVKIAWY